MKATIAQENQFIWTQNMEQASEEGVQGSNRRSMMRIQSNYNLKRGLNDKSLTHSDNNA